MLHSLRQDAVRQRRLPRGRLALLRGLPSSLAMVVLVRLGLTFTGLDVLRRRLLPIAAPMRTGNLVDAARVAWSVSVVSRIVPFASCLTQAQSCQALLAARGIYSDLCLGVREDANGALRAHAWLLCANHVVIGGETEDLRRFRLLTQLGPTR